MKHLKSFKVAVVIAVVVCILATLLGMRISVSRKASKLEKVFTSNTDGSDKGIGLYLKQIDESANNLISLGKQTGTSTDALSAARDSYAKAKTYGEYYDAYLDICSAADLLNAELEGKQLTENDRKLLQKYYQDGIKDQKDKLSHMAVGFNESVDEYNNMLKRFPLNLFRYLIGAKEAERFE